MMKLRSKLLAAVSVVAVAGAVAAAGLTAASASQAAGAASSGFEHFQLMNATVANRRAVEHHRQGRVHRGRCGPPGQQGGHGRVPGRDIQDRALQRHRHPALQPQDVPEHHHLERHLPAERHGTGAYAGISGHGIYRLNILIVGARNSAGKCSNKLPPTAFQQIIRAQGPVSL